MDGEGEGRIHALEGGRRLHQDAERNGADEIGGRHHQRRKHAGDVHVAVDEAGKPRLMYDQRLPVAHQRTEALAELSALDRLAVQERHRLGIVGHPRHGETEVGLVTVLLEIERNERPPDQVRDQRPEHGIEKRHHDQVAGKRQIDAE